MRAIWLVGEPGSGKTTLARKLLGGALNYVLKPKWTLAPGIAAAGHYRGNTFDGADTVPYNGAKEALEYWAANLQGLDVLFDGDRFSNANSVHYVSLNSGHGPVCAYLSTPAQECARRRAERGTGQNPTWVRGRATKAFNFYLKFQGEKISGNQEELLELLTGGKK